MSTSVITGKVTDNAGTALQFVKVRARLIPRPAFLTSDGSEISVFNEYITDVNGEYAMTLTRTADITPADSIYEVVEFIPPRYGGAVKHIIQVGAIAATVLASKLSFPPTPQVHAYLTQAAADARYVLSPGSFGASGSISESRPGDVAAGGALASYARTDHKHDREQWSGTNAARLALAGTDLFAGLHYFTTDTKREWLYSGSTWYLLPTLNTPRVKAADTSNAGTVATATVTPIPMASSDVYDTDSMHNPGANPSRITLPFIGLWRVSYTFMWDESNATGIRQTWISVNTAGAGTGIRYAFSVQDGFASGSVPAITASDVIVNTAITDYIELIAYQDSGTTLDFGGGISYDVSMTAVYKGPVF